MSAGAFLKLYLRDHHAAAAAGVDLARRLVRHGRTSEDRDELSELAHLIAADRDTLTDILGSLNVKSSVPKTVLARVGGELSSLKPNGAIATYSPLDRVIELETLATGIVGKRALWRSLAIASTWAPALSSVDFEQLIVSADEQYERVERLRMEAAMDAFSNRPARSRLRSGRSGNRQAV